jgi:periplasmic divalent cation tolerance protein
MNDYIEVSTTTQTKEEAEKIAGVLVEERLAACVQVIGPITSTYRWEGAVEKEEEWLCTIKTKRSLWGEVEHAIKSLHPYEVPEMVALPVVAGSSEYLRWMGDQLRK